MFETSHIEIDKAALLNNINFIRSVLGPDSEFVAVIKGNAYGHGIETFAPLLKECKVDSVAVFSAFEAHKVIQTEVRFNRILIMGQVDDEDLKWAIENNIEFFVFDTNRLISAIEYAKEVDKKALIHIELETGLNRTGFSKKELKEVIQLIQNNSACLSVEGICSHLAGAEDIANYYRIKRQTAKFKQLTKLLAKHGINPKYKHLACSAAIMNYPKTISNMARVGIMQYGFWPSKQVKMGYMVKGKNQVDPLKRVISWKSKVLSVKEVEAGEYIGYGNSVLAELRTKIATVPVGYAHGFSRSLSNQGKVLINEVRVDVIGTVNMNMIMVDLTNLKHIQKGDEVVLIGNQGDLSISVASFSDLSVQLNYELLTRLPNDIPRIVIN